MNSKEIGDRCDIHENCRQTPTRSMRALVKTKTSETPNNKVDHSSDELDEFGGRRLTA